MQLFITCPKNLELLLEQELISLGAQQTKQTVAGVKVEGDIELAYRICLWSRLANRVLLPLDRIPAVDAEELYDGIRDINWLEHFEPSNTFVVDFAGHSETIINTQFGAQKVKDAIVDQMREETGQRPSVNKENPDIRVNVYLHNDIATVSLDLSGESLHRRGYRQKGGAAPLKENLAAAILSRLKWAELAKQNLPLLDPMCGSGTIIIEAAMIAADIAPGLLRQSFGFQKWLNHDAALWQKLWKEAEQRRKQGLKKLPPIYGFDAYHDVIEMAKDNIKQAGLSEVISVAVCDVKDLTNPEAGNKPGIIVTNPPYGERLGDHDSLRHLYRQLGETIINQFPGWQIAMLITNKELGKATGLHAKKQYAFFNGAIPCRLLLLV